MSTRTLFLKFMSSAALAITAVSAQAAPTEEWASTLISFSSQWSSGAWSANQVLGAPDTFAYGDIASAWAPGPVNGTLEYITVGFLTPTYSTGALIRETYGNGFVYQIDALDSSSNLHTVWTGTDSSAPGTPVDFTPSWGQTAFLTTGLKIYTNTDHDLGAWEEIDAIKLYGNTVAAVPEPETYAMLLAGLGVLGFMGKRRKAG